MMVYRINNTKQSSNESAYKYVCVGEIALKRTDTKKLVSHIESILFKPQSISTIDFKFFVIPLLSNSSHFE